MTIPTSEWQPIETAPRVEGTRVLLWWEAWSRPDLDIVLIGRFIGGHWETDRDGRLTHWMPLPASPWGDGR